MGHTLETIFSLSSCCLDHTLHHGCHHLHQGLGSSLLGQDMAMGTKVVLSFCKGAILSPMHSWWDSPVVLLRHLPAWGRRREEEEKKEEEEEEEEGGGESRKEKVMKEEVRGGRSRKR